MPDQKRIYFASDFHLGDAGHKASAEREALVVSWLDSIKEDAGELYLVGDIFDFWFEYKHAVPRGYIRFLGKLAELADSGVRITMFKGNHDMWMFDYFTKELGIGIVADDLVFERNGKTFYVHHGDGLGPGDRKYKLLKKIFRSRLCQWLFARIHPNLGIAIAQAWSRKSRLVKGSATPFTSEENEWLVTYSKEVLEKTHFDFFIFGHRHLPLNIALQGKDGRTSRYINLGQWINLTSFAVFDGENLELRSFKQTDVILP